MHARELKKTTNTGRLAVKALENSEMLVRGRVGEPLDLRCLLDPKYRSILFYPAEHAEELTAEFVHDSSLPIQLIVPDGTWRQASKIHHRHTELKHLPRVMIKTPNLETRHLRVESTREGMATLQAIAHALGVIEGDEIKQILLAVYKLKLDQTLHSRGRV